jgi:preprotein translocase subunit YajC
MIAATFMSVLFTPVFYVVMQRLGERRRKSREVMAEPEVQDATSPAASRNE